MGAVPERVCSGDNEPRGMRVAPGDCKCITATVLLWRSFYLNPLPHSPCPMLYACRCLLSLTPTVIQSPSHRETEGGGDEIGGGVPSPPAATTAPFVRFFVSSFGDPSGLTPRTGASRCVICRQWYTQIPVQRLRSSYLELLPQSRQKAGPGARATPRPLVAAMFRSMVSWPHEICWQSGRILFLTFSSSAAREYHASGQESSTANQPLLALA